jgi:uncharacterized protein (DUF2336 family)
VGRLTLSVKSSIRILTVSFLAVNPAFTDPNLSEIMSFTHPLIQLAGDPTRAAREALVSATADQFLGDANAATLRECALFSDILVKLYSFARQEIRQRLSAALAMADWAPVELVRELALDTIAVAQPIISFCPVINDKILVEVIQSCDFEHRICVAERPCIGEMVSGKLIQTQNQRVVAALAKNTTARIDGADFKKAMTILSDSQDDIDALVGRHDLPPTLVAAAYGLAGAQTRLAISMRLPPKLDQRLTRLTEFVASDAADGRTTQALNTKLNDAVRTTVRSKSATFPPTPGFLIAALMRGERAAFFTGLGVLLSLPGPRVAQKMTGADTDTIALVARAANFDATVGRAWTTEKLP